MYFGSKILISEREMTPSQHAQTQENRKKNFFFSIFCGQKLVGKIFLRPTPCVTVYRGGGGAVLAEYVSNFKKYVKSTIVQ